ncbi:MAG TPA: GAF domain-containing protein [Anaerolineales bacterium]|nr:GAF domain-containing protein [Anaerolineales bacterium]
MNGRQQQKTSRIRTWLNNIPVEDPINRQMAALLQIILIGLVIVILISTILNLFLVPPDTPRSEIVIQSILILSIFITPVILLRRGYFRIAVIIIIAIFIVLVSASIYSSDLRDTADSLTFFTIGILLAGLLVGRTTMFITFTISASVVLSFALNETDPTLKLDNIQVAGNFILLNGLVAIFVNSFGTPLRNALHSSLQRENDLKEEIAARRRFELDLKNALEREQHLNEVTSAISSKLDLNTILSTVVQLTAELVDADAGAMSLISPDGQTIFHHNLYNLPDGLELTKPVPKRMPNWEATNLYSLIEVPMIVGDNCLGTLSEAKSDPDLRFSDRDRALVESVGRQTAIAIQNARLFEAQQHELNERIRIEKEREELIEKLEEQNDELTRFTYTVSMIFAILLSPSRAFSVY